VPLTDGPTLALAWFHEQRKLDAIEHEHPIERVRLQNDRYLRRLFEVAGNQAVAEGQEHIQAR
jgi:hypothetical protein